MKNYRHPGDNITVVAPRALTSGEGFLAGALFCVATQAAANAATLEAKTSGVFEFPCVTTDTAASGALAYWDNTNFRFTTTASGNTIRGVFAAPKASGPALATIRLQGVAI